MNYQHLHFQFPAEPFQRWHVIIDRDLPPRYRHPRKPGEKPDPRVNFGASELSARLEHAGVEYARIAISNNAAQVDQAWDVLVRGEFGFSVNGDGPWYPSIPWVRDDGFYAVCLCERVWERITTLILPITIRRATWARERRYAQPTPFSAEGQTVIFTSSER